MPKKFFHTAGNFREHEEESKQVDWSHKIAPWIVFFQNVDALVGQDEPVIYPEHLTEELDYELELAVVIGRDGKWFGPEEAMDYVAGYVIFNDITARDIQRREMESGVFSFCKAIDTFCPLGPWIVTADEIPDPHDLAMELRVNGEVRQRSHSGRMSVTIPEIVSHYSALGYSAGDVLSTGTVSGVAGFSPGRRVALPEARRRDGGGDREDRRAPQPGDLVAGRPRRAGPAARALVVGSYEIDVIIDAEGSFTTYDEAFPEATEDDWAPWRDRHSELFADDRWRLPFACFLIRSKGRTILVDTGVGPAGGDFLPSAQGRLPGELDRLGAEPDTVFLTHIHVDHIGWNHAFEGVPFVTHSDVDRARRGAREPVPAVDRGRGRGRAGAGRRRLRDAGPPAGPHERPSRRTSL